MLEKFLNKSTINILENVKDWQDSINIVSKPLIKNKIIEKRYVDAIFKTHEDLGPYYVLAPGIAMPHARPEQGSNGMGLSLLIVKNGVNFNSLENDPVYIIVMLAAKDSDSHIELISSLSDLLDNEQDINVLKNGSLEEIIKVIEKY